jgi:vacuolar-type H+-ATPase subunit C/Vma6
VYVSCSCKKKKETGLKHLLNNDLLHYQGPFPIISYIIKKEIETKNLFIISRTIYSKLGSDFAKEMMII